MRRQDLLDKLRRHDPKVAGQLEDALARKDKASGKSPEAAQGGCEPAKAGPRCDDAGQEPRAAVSAPERASEAPASPETAEPPEAPVSAPGPASAEEDPPMLGRAEEASEEPQAPSPYFVNAEAQAGLPEVPQTLVSTEATPEVRLAETWAGYEDDYVPEGEQERRRAERAAARAAQRTRDREHAAQMGFFPGAWFRRHGTGDHVSCKYLELQLDGIACRVNRASTWDEGRSATQTMDNVEAQSFSVRDLGDRPASIPEALRGRYPGLTRTQLDVLRVVVTAYAGGALGVYEYQPILASDLGMSERAMRYALNGGKGRPPGLVELGLVKKRQTWKRGAGDRPSDHHYLLLQAGPTLVEELLPRVCKRQAELGHRIPRKTGYTKTAARVRAGQGRQAGRRARRDLAEQALERRSRWGAKADSEGAGLSAPATPRAQGCQPQRPEPSRGCRKEEPLNCAAQNADNPIPPLTGEGVLRSGRGKPPSPPKAKAPLRVGTLAPASPPLPKTNGSDPPALSEEPLCDRARALDEVARPRPSDLDVWRRRRARGVKIPDSIDQVLFAETLTAARNAILGGSE